MPHTPPRVAILGAGPIGLEAALAAAEGRWPFTVYERADTVAFLLGAKSTGATRSSCCASAGSRSRTSSASWTRSDDWRPPAGARAGHPAGPPGHRGGTRAAVGGAAPARQARRGDARAPDPGLRGHARRLPALQTGPHPPLPLARPQTPAH